MNCGTRDKQMKIGKILTHTILLILVLQGCSQKKPMERHLFYLHGRIIETQGIKAYSEKFGRYEYQSIIDTLKNFGLTIHNEIRTEKTIFEKFCYDTSNQIDSLIKLGIKPQYITVVGASKGGVMAMYISHINQNPINYVLLGANNNQIETENNWSLNGNILGIYEISDSIAGKSYEYWIKNSPKATKFEQLELNTGLGHGFLYKPLQEWVNPLKNWINE